MRLALLLLAIACAWPCPGHCAEGPGVRRVAPGTWFVQERLHEGHEPDGNSVVYEAPRGLVVLDAGRHAWHREALLRLAKQLRQPIVTLVNSHWHLDHTGGNAALRAAYPGLEVVAGDGLDAALTGFLAQGLLANEQALADPALPQSLKDDLHADSALIREGAKLRPDVVVASSATMRLGGRPLQVHLARDAATATDLWLYDARTRVVAVGDLVTLPAPFLDTACPAGWRAALDEVAATPFALALPGHGAPMRRAQFLAWRKAFGGLIDCAASARPAADCAGAWARDVRPLQDAAEAGKASSLAAYYVEMLRRGGGRSAWCRAPG